MHEMHGKHKGHWATTDDGQHIFIGGDGKVYGGRDAMNQAGGAGLRGRALANRSKAALAGVQARRAGMTGKPSLREQASAARAAKGGDEKRASRLLSKISTQKALIDESDAVAKIAQLKRMASREGVSDGVRANLESQTRQQEQRLAAVLKPRQARLDSLQSRRARVKSLGGITW